MISLRITKCIKNRPVRTYLRMALWCLVALGLYGCGSATPPDNDSSSNGSTQSMPGSNDPSWLTSREKFPPPGTDRIEYDAKNRMLILYDLPGRDNWMVQLPDEMAGRLVGPQYRLPEGIDTTRTLVYFSRAGMKVSASVTVSQIEAGRLSHTSLAIDR